MITYLLIVTTALFCFGNIVVIEAENCTNPPMPENGKVEPDSGVFQKYEFVTQSCNEGYNVIGSGLQLFCVGQDNWFGGINCEIIDCNAPNAIPNGVITLDNGETTYGSNATIICNVGHFVDGAEFIQCNGDGVWSAHGNCENIENCINPPVPDNGKVEPDSGVFRLYEYVTQSCNEGYNVIGSGLQLFCVGQDNWFGGITCEIIDCNAPDAIPNGDITLNNGATTYGSNATVICNEGHLVDGAEIIQCNSDGVWSAHGNCENIENCTSPPVPENGKVGPYSGVFQLYESVTQSCNEGYNVIGSGLQLFCIGQDNWIGGITCEIIDCNAPDAIPNGDITLDNGETTHRSNATVICNEGHFVEGAEIIQCNSDGVWTAHGNCEKIDCGEPADFSDGSVTDISSTKFGGTATVNCNIGYQTNVTSSNTMQCSSSGTWEPGISCLIVDCGDPPAPENGEVNLVSGNTVVGSQAVQSCLVGYSNTAAFNQIFCVPNGWSSSIKCSIVDCGTPNDIINGQIKLAGNTTTFGSIATVTCNEGHIIDGTTVIQCQESGIWGKEGTCEKIDCGQPMSPNNGEVIYDSESTVYESTATINCDAGYVINVTSSNTIQCSSTATWEPTIGCDITDFGELTSTTDGELQSTGGTTYSSTDSSPYDSGCTLNGAPSVYTIYIFIYCQWYLHNVIIAYLCPLR